MCGGTGGTVATCVGIHRWEPAGVVQVVQNVGVQVVQNVGVQVAHVWAYTGGSVGKSRPFPTPQPPLPLVNHNWCPRPFQNMTSVCSLGKPLPQPKQPREKNCLKLGKADCMTTFPMQILIPKSKHRH